MESNNSLLPKVTLTGNVWLISFGDLLTLVLCFFISVISLSPLNPGVKAPAKPGIQLADNKKNIQAETSGNKSLSLSIFEKDLAASEVSITDAAIERLKNQVSPAGYKTREVKVETCWRSGESDLSGSWEKTLGLLGGLRRQVFDAIPGMDAKKILFRNLAADCEANAAARITLEF
jgi:flagellar motor protein MotB